MNSSRLLWVALAVALLIASVSLCVHLGWGTAGIIAVAAVAPDLALIGAFAGGGRLRPERVRFYNLMHSASLASATLTAGAVLALLTPQRWLLLVGLAWLTHIAVDRACGYGPREADGTIRRTVHRSEVPA
ncbi:DUF4260 family protein [Leucobacter sp. HY1910]